MFVHMPKAHPNNTYLLVEGELGGEAQVTDGVGYWYTDRAYRCERPACRCQRG